MIKYINNLSSSLEALPFQYLIIKFLHKKRRMLKVALLPSFNVKDILELVKKGATVEAQEKIMELREAALGLQEENIKLKERLKALEEELKWGTEGTLLPTRGTGGTLLPTLHCFFAPRSPTSRRLLL